eukprot:10413-Heterococcus_DN1.PRE.3
MLRYTSTQPTNQRYSGEAGCQNLRFLECCAAAAVDGDSFAAVAVAVEAAIVVSEPLRDV